MGDDRNERTDIHAEDYAQRSLVALWRSIFGWKALFRWDAIGALVPGIFVAVGLGMLGIDWFPHHLVVSEVCFSLAGVLTIVKIVGHTIETTGHMVARAAFVIALILVVLTIVVPLEIAIEHHRENENQQPVIVRANNPAPIKQSEPTVVSRDHVKRKATSPSPPQVVVESGPSYGNLQQSLLELSRELEQLIQDESESRRRIAQNEAMKPVTEQETTQQMLEASARQIGLRFFYGGLEQRVRTLQEDMAKLNFRNADLDRTMEEIESAKSGGNELIQPMQINEIANGLSDLANQLPRQKH